MTIQHHPTRALKGPGKGSQRRSTQDRSPFSWAMPPPTMPPHLALRLDDLLRVPQRDAQGLLHGLDLCLRRPVSRAARALAVVAAGARPAGAHLKSSRGKKAGAAVLAATLGAWPGCGRNGQGQLTTATRRHGVTTGLLMCLYNCCRNRGTVRDRHSPRAPGSSSEQRRPEADQRTLLAL
jgi:hypothetical protein